MTHPLRGLVLAALLVLAACGEETAEREPEPLSGGGPSRPSTGEAVADPAATFDRPPLEIQVPHGEPRAVTLVDQGAAPHQELRLRPETGTVQRIKVSVLHNELSIYTEPGRPQQTNNVTAGPYHHVADTVVVDSVGDRFTYDRWLFDYDISGTGRGYENLDLRSEFAAAERSDGTRLLVTDRNDVLGFAVLGAVVPDDNVAIQRTLLGESVILAALPAEPVGIGARWTIHAVGPTRGFVFDHNATLELVELHPDRAVVQISQESTPRPQAEQTRYYQDLQEYRITTSGTITYRFDLPVPLSDITVDTFRRMGTRSTLDNNYSDHIIVELAE